MDEGDLAGGSLALGELIDEHGSAIAADLQAHYGLSLRDLIADLCSDQPHGSPWWVLALIEGLPEGSAYVASRLGGPQWRGWTFDRHLLAAIFDALQINTVTTARAAGAKGVKAPKPIQRPGDGAKKARAGVPITAMIPRRKPAQT